MVEVQYVAHLSNRVVMVVYQGIYYRLDDYKMTEIMRNGILRYYVELSDLAAHNIIHGE